MTRPQGEDATAPGEGGPGAGGRVRLFALAVLGFALLALVAYRPALDGPFVSDDSVFLLQNPYVQRADWRGAFDPRSDARFFAGGSYQPLVHVVLSVEWRVFGNRTRGYHLVNLGLHALACGLLVLLLLDSGVSRLAALLAGAVFALHPANVDAVAWISQIRSLLGLGLALLALLLLRERPLASVPVFALALLSKALAAFALPMAATLLWCRRGSTTRLASVALGLWALLFTGFAPLEWMGISAHPPPHARAFPDLASQLRMVVAIGARYLAMAATGHGTAAFHEPEPVRSALDPWWLAGLALTPLLLWRVLSGLRQRREEAAWWIGAAAAFVPVSQVFPFFFGMADRYLYFILPGLLGGSLLCGRAGLARLAARAPSPRLAPGLRAAATVAALGLVALLGLRTSERTPLWVSQDRLVQDAADRYPDGIFSHYLVAVAWLEAGNRDQALAHLVECGLRGAYVLRPFYADPALAPLASDPRFQELLRIFAALRIEMLEDRRVEDQPSLYGLAEAWGQLGDYDRALAVAEHGIRRGGPLDGSLIILAQQLRRQRSEQARGGGDALPQAASVLEHGEALRRLEAMIAEGGPLPRPAPRPAPPPA